MVLAYKSGRDTTLLTTKRYIKLDVRGITGKSCRAISLPWERVRLYSVETAAQNCLDGDAEFKLYSDLSKLPCLEQDLKRSCDVGKLQMFLSSVVCSESG